MRMVRLIVGGLGGGGDVVLALMMVKAAGIDFSDISVLSFRGCSIRGDRIKDLVVEGALIEVSPQKGVIFASRRVFEDKIHLTGITPRGVYMICTKESWGDMVKGLRRVIEDHKPSCLFHTDVGGDSIVLGYEERLGSFKADTVARALLAHASRSYGVKSFIASAAVGAEGGGDELSLEWLAATLEFLRSKGALSAVTTLPNEVGDIGAEFLKYADSGMIPILLAAMRGRREAEIDMAYLHGRYEVRPWYRYVFVLDALKHCELSPLCKLALGHGIQALRNYRREKKVPPELKRYLRQVSKVGVERAFSSLVRNSVHIRRVRCLSG